MSVQNMTVTTTMRFRRDCASALPSSEAWIQSKSWRMVVGTPVILGRFRLFCLRAVIDCSRSIDNFVWTGALRIQVFVFETRRQSALFGAQFMFNMNTSCHIMDYKPPKCPPLPPCFSIDSVPYNRTENYRR